MNSTDLFNSTMEMFERQYIDFNYGKEERREKSSKSSSPAPTIDKNKILTTVICTLKYGGILPDSSGHSGTITSAKDLSSYFMHIPSTSIISYFNSNGYPPRGYFGNIIKTISTLKTKTQFIDFYNKESRDSTQPWNELYNGIKTYSSYKEKEILGCYGGSLLIK